MEIPNNQITHSLRTLGYDKQLGTGLSGSEYRALVSKLDFTAMPTPSALTTKVRTVIKSMPGRDFKERRHTASRIRLIKSALRVIASELEVGVSLSKSDYPEVIKLIDAMKGEITATRIAPMLAEYIFGSD